ncbi:MAG: SpoVR family protein [Planctomycetota bacterium]|nr:SpoVR family protein [Planctomycetota bacterium]MDA1178721.1 SpoVR family protein [Planctomycetota bacterium]
MIAAHSTRLPADLSEIQVHIEACARGYGLDFFSVLFELVDVDELNAIAAYGGFPTRYPHWRFGMEYEQLQKGYRYGLQKIYELVINNNPCYAYLLRSNSITDHTLVMAHVYGHCDFFKRNAWFSQTNRKMIDEMANHGNRIRRYMDRFGRTVVETFIDACLSLENLIDPHSPFIQRYSPRDRYQFLGDAEEQEVPDSARRFESKPYMESYINPPEALRRDREMAQSAATVTWPESPMRDVLLFLLNCAPLRPWQVDVLSIIRDEAYYFAPQGQTKIMNEGWATYWHSTIMTRHGLEGGDVITYADHCAGTLASSPMRLNPYKLGVELFRDIEDRWNRGRFGRDYEECADLQSRLRWNTEVGLGREKIFEVRQIHNDVTFIDEFLTLEFCDRHRLFSFGYNTAASQYEIESRKFAQVKQRLLFSLTNRGLPIIYLKDGNYKNRGELYLEHQFNGPELKVSDAQETLRSLHTLWTRPVHIETILDGKITVLSFDGTEHSTHKTAQNAERTEVSS